MVKFKEINGQLCKMLEKPVPLTPDAQFPCVVRLIQDSSPIGKLNEYEIRRLGKKTIIAVEFSENGVVRADDRYFYEHYTRYEILGYPVVDGSRWWALYHMQSGNAVFHTKAPSIKYSMPTHYVKRKVRENCTDDMSIQVWLSGADETGWQLYEPKEEAIKDPESPIDPVELPLRKLIFQAEEEGKNIRTYYQDMVFTPVALTGLLAEGRFRWWNICNWEITDREQNWYPQIKLEPESEPEPCPACNSTGVVQHETQNGATQTDLPISDATQIKVGDWVEMDYKGTLSHRQVISVHDNGIRVKFVGVTPLLSFDGKNNIVSMRLVRKISPSEVVIDFGSFKGTIELNSHPFGNQITVRNTQGDAIAYINIVYLDTPTRELVQELLKKQQGDAK